MKTYWIVVADAGRALVLSKIAGSDASTLVHDLENPAGRMRTSQLVSDEQGRMAKMRGDSKSAMDPPTDPHEQKAVIFAREISRLLEAAADRHEFDSLILIAPGHFLGLLNSRLTGEAKKRLATSQTKDLTHASLADMETHIAELLRQSRITANG
jgi:protein required for attachment to host cells